MSSYAVVLALFFISVFVIAHESAGIIFRVLRAGRREGAFLSGPTEPIARWMGHYGLLPEDLFRTKLILASVLVWGSLILVYLQYCRNPGFLVITLLLGVMMLTASLFIAFVLPDRVSTFLYERYIHRMNRQLVDAMNIMSMSLRSGGTILKSLETVAQMAPVPLRQEFGQACMEMQSSGATLEQAMERLAERLPFKDMRIFVSTLLIVTRVGGSYASVLDRGANLIRERFRVKQKCWALSADGRFMAIALALAPLINFAFFLAMDQEKLFKFITHPIGCLAVVAIGIMDYIGYRWIKRIISVQF